MSSSSKANGAENANDAVITIAIMGPMGSGKSSFIKSITKDPAIVVGSNLGPETSVVAAYPVTIDSVQYRLIDTPGFDDTYLSNYEVLERIAAWVEKAKPQIRLSGIIYLYRITDPKFHGGSQNSFRIFHKLCGNDHCSNVVFATTFWDKVPSMEVGIYRENYLKGTAHWAHMIEGGAQVERIESYDKCHHLLKAIAKKVAQVEPKRPHLQAALAEGTSRAAVVASIADDPEVAALKAKQVEKEKEVKAAAKKKQEIKDARHRERLQREQERRQMEFQEQQERARQKVEKSKRAAREAEEKRQKLEQESHARAEAIRLSEFQKEQTRAELQAAEARAQALRRQQGHNSSDTEDAVICCASTCCCFFILGVVFVIILVIIFVCIHVFAGLL